MIDGDEIITIASETGYRLCLCDDIAESNQYFSATWCPNNKNAYYACSMDGYVRYTNTIADSNKKFEILFRKFSGVSDKQIEPARRISLHWDKMCLIPTRPGDVLFLLGVAKALFYSAFPGSLSPMATSVHSCCPGFTYGTPVMELMTHTNRITAVEVSPCGHIVATGDANGYVKMIILNRPESLQYTINKRHTEEFNFSFADATLNSTGIRCHTGPVFSVKWLQTMSPEAEDSDSDLDSLGPSHIDKIKLSFSLATGSCDRCVRLWSVQWDRKGITVNHIATLDTLSSSILGLSSTILMQREVIAAERPYSPSRMSPGSTALSTSGKKRCGKIQQSNSTSVTVHRTQILLGCTDIGTIYVWRVNPYLITATPEHPPTIDTGLHLISMVHSSDYPIINASMVLIDKSEPRSVLGDGIFPLHTESVMDTSLLLLAASDTRGVVRMHHASMTDIIQDEGTSPTNLSTSARSPMSPSSRAMRLSPSTDQRSPRSIGMIVRQLTASPSRCGGRPPAVLFSLVGEAMYDFPVLMCCFRFITERMGQDGAISTSVHTHVSEVDTSVLNVYLANGTLKQMKSEVLCQLPRNTVTLDRSDDEMSATDEDEVPRLSVPVASPRHADTNTLIAETHAKPQDEHVDNTRGMCIGSEYSDDGRCDPAPEYVTDEYTMRSTQQSVRTNREKNHGPAADDPTQRTPLRRGSGKVVSISESKNTVISAVKEPKFQLDEEITKEPLSMLSEPALNSSKAFLERLQRMEEIDCEDVSISSAETGSTDRHFVADSVVNVRFSGGRYMELPDITEEEIARRMPHKPQLRPQVDRQWKAQKAQQAPSAECISKITPRDAVVTLNMVVNEGGAVREELVSCDEREMGDLSSFAVNVDVNNVFGRLQASCDWRDPHEHEALDNFEDMSTLERYGLM